MISVRISVLHVFRNLFKGTHELSFGFWCESIVLVMIQLVSIVDIIQNSVSPELVLRSGRVHQVTVGIICNSET